MGFVLLLSLNTNYYTYEIGYFLTIINLIFFFLLFFSAKGSSPKLWCAMVCGE